MTCEMFRAFENRSLREKSIRVSARVSTCSLLARGNLFHPHTYTRACARRDVEWTSLHVFCQFIGHLQIVLVYSAYLWDFMNNSYTTCMKQLWKKLKSSKPMKLFCKIQIKSVLKNRCCISVFGDIVFTKLLLFKMHYLEFILRLRIWLDYI